MNRTGEQLYDDALEGARELLYLRRKNLDALIALMEAEMAFQKADAPPALIASHQDREG